MDLKDKVVLIIGGVSLNGRAYCEEFLRHGCKISICDIDTIAGEEIARTLSKLAKDRVIFCSCDVTDYPQFEEAFQTTVSKLGGIDIVINNASVMNDRLWELEVDVNLNGIIRGLLLSFRFLGRDRGGQGGVVVNVGSSSSARPMISLPVYTATKHAIAVLTRCYGDQYHVNLTGIKVISVCPSPTQSALSCEPRKKLLNGEYDHAWESDIENIMPLKPEYLSKSIIELVKKAPSGTSWLIEESKPIREINIFPK